MLFCAQMDVTHQKDEMDAPEDVSACMSACPLADATELNNTFASTYQAESATTDASILHACVIAQETLLEQTLCEEHSNGSRNESAVAQQDVSAKVTADENQHTATPEHAECWARPLDPMLIVTHSPGGNLSAEAMQVSECSCEYSLHESVCAETATQCDGSAIVNNNLIAQPEGADPSPQPVWTWMAACAAGSDQACATCDNADSFAFCLPSSSSSLSSSTCIALDSSDTLNPEPSMISACSTSDATTAQLTQPVLGNACVDACGAGANTDSGAPLATEFSHEALAEYHAMCEEHKHEPPITSPLSDIMTPVHPNVGVAGNGGLLSDDTRLWRLIETSPGTLFEMLRIAYAESNGRIVYLLLTMIAVAAENMSVETFRRVFGSLASDAAQPARATEEELLGLGQMFGNAPPLLPAGC
jgi:hypothetical protein